MKSFDYDAPYAACSEKGINNGHEEHVGLTRCPFYTRWDNMRQIHNKADRVHIDPTFASFMQFKAWCERQTEDVRDYRLLEVPHGLVGPNAPTGPLRHVLVHTSLKNVFMVVPDRPVAPRKRVTTVRDPFRLLDAKPKETISPSAVEEESPGLPRWVYEGQGEYWARTQVLGKKVQRKGFKNPIDAHLHVLAFYHKLTLPMVEAESEEAQSILLPLLDRVKECIDKKIEFSV